MDDIFSPRTLPLISESIFDLITEETEEQDIYEAEPDDTPWYWYTTDQRNWIAQGVTHIPYDELWWKEFTDYEGLYVESWGSSFVTNQSPVTAIYQGTL